MSRTHREEWFFIGYSALAMMAFTHNYDFFGWVASVMAVGGAVGSLFYAIKDGPSPK